MGLADRGTTVDTEFHTEIHTNWQSLLVINSAAVAIILVIDDFDNNDDELIGTNEGELILEG